MITNEALEHQAKSLAGTTMPNGEKYEDWLKDKRPASRLRRTATLRKVLRMIGGRGQ